MPPQVETNVADLAADPKIAACLDWFRRNSGWINEQHLKLCRVPAPTFLEQTRAEWMAERFRESGWESGLDRAGNVIAALPGNVPESPLTSLNPAASYVAMTAHLDTVLAPRVPEDVRVSDDGRFLGPGVSDNGAGLAALLAIAAVWNASPPLTGTPRVPLLVANVGEEGEGNLSGMRFLCRSANPARPHAFLVLDGPGCEHVTCRALASRRYEVVLHGPGGHSWSDHGAANPVHALSRVIARFTDAQAGISPDAAGAPNIASTKDPATRPPRTSYNFGLVQGGTSVNSIPVEARAKVDLRSEDPAIIQDLADQLAFCVDRAVDEENRRATTRGAAGGRLTARVAEIGSRPGGELAPDSGMLERIQAVDQFLGIRGFLDCSSTDANIPLSLGIPAVSIGAGGRGGGAHTPGEWFHPEGRERGLRRILLTLCLLLLSE